MRAPGLGTRLVHFGFGPRAHRYLINQGPVLLRAFTGLVEKSHFNLNGFIQAAAWDFSSSFAAQLSLLLLTWSSGLCRPRELYVGAAPHPPCWTWLQGSFLQGFFPASQQNRYKNCVQFSGAEPTAFVWEEKEWFYLMTC